MPTSKPPRKRYRPRAVFAGSRRPSIDEAWVVFEPLFRLFDQLRTGYVDDAAGRPIMKEWDGEWCEIAPALLGWADCWSRIAEAERLVLDTEPLRRIARKLAAVCPLTEAEVEAGRASMMLTHAAFLRLPVGTIKRHANAEEISIALENLAHHESAAAASACH
jgi:hypothetical protein